MNTLRKAAECVGRDCAEVMFTNQMTAARDNGVKVTAELVAMVRSSLGLPTEGVTE
jgi:hypothetical protein